MALWPSPWRPTDLKGKAHHQDAASAALAAASAAVNAAAAAAAAAAAGGGADRSTGRHLLGVKNVNKDAAGVVTGSAAGVPNAAITSADDCAGTLFDSVRRLFCAEIGLVRLCPSPPPDDVLLQNSSRR